MEQQDDAGELLADLLASLPTDEEAISTADALLLTLPEPVSSSACPQLGLSTAALGGEELLSVDPTLLDTLCAPEFVLDGALASNATTITTEFGGVPTELTSQVVTASLVTNTKQASRRSDPNKARAEQRRELLALRSQAAQMERQVEEMRARQMTAMNALVKKSSPRGAQNGESEKEADTKFTDVWRQVCLRQLERRLQAEKENAMLRDAVLKRMRVTGAINAALRNSSMDEPIGGLSRNRALSIGAPPSDPEVDREIYTQLLADVDRDIYKVDDFLDDNALVDVDTPRQGTQVRQCGGRLVLDVFVSSLLPFDWRVSSFAVWRFYKGPGKHYGPVYDKMAQTSGAFEDTVIENFVIEVAANDVRADFRVRQVLKRFDQPNRQVVVWRNDFQPVDYVNRSVNFGFRETGYAICRAPCSQPSSVEPMTVLTIGNRLSPYMKDPTGRQLSLKANIKDIAHFTFTSLHVELRAKLDRIENLLLDERRRNAGSSTHAHV